MPTARDTLEDTLTDIITELMEQDPPTAEEPELKLTFLDQIPAIADAIDVYISAVLTGGGFTLTVPAGIAVAVDVGTGVGATTEDGEVTVEAG